MPEAAIPAAKVTAYSSAIPTSKKRSGYVFLNVLSPVPDGIAAVMAVTLSFSFAMASSVLEKTSV